MKLIEPDIIHNAKLIGKNLRLLRTIYEKTIDEIAKASNLSNAHISLLERGKRIPKNGDLRKILRCYGYTLGYFLSEIQDTVTNYNIHPNSIVVPKGKQILLDGTRNNNSYSLLLMRPLRYKDDLEMIYMYLPANTQLSDEYQTLDCEIRGIVTAGRLLISFKDDEFICNEGEEFCFDGYRQHIFRNFTTQPVQSIIMLNPATF
jgi:transcriptional regulator with XRE-family HTH domain